MDELCILAGDIGNPYQKNFNIFMNYISKNFQKIFFITGNHEYYNKTKTIQETNEFLKKYFVQFNNISFLNNTFEMYNNYCFIGTTYWRKITDPTYEINDTYKIPNFNYIEYNRLNRLSINFLQDSLEKNENCIVITHHIPSNLLIDIKYKTLKMMNYNQWFYCNLEDLINKNVKKIKYWIYGHTPTSSMVIMNEIPFLCNPIGYSNENSKVDFQKYFIIGG